VQLW